MGVTLGRVSMPGDSMFKYGYKLGTMPTRRTDASSTDEQPKQEAQAAVLEEIRLR